MGLEQLLGAVNDKLERVTERLVRLEEREKHRAKELENASDRLERGDDSFAELTGRISNLDARLRVMEDRGKDFGVKFWEILKTLFASLLGGLVTLFIWWLTR